MSIQSLNPSLRDLDPSLDGKEKKLAGKKKKKDKHRKGSKSSRSSEASSGSASVSDGGGRVVDAAAELSASSAGSINDHDAETGAKVDHKKKDSSRSTHQDRIPTIPEEPPVPEGGKQVTVSTLQPNISFRFDDVSDELLHGTAAPYVSKEEQYRVLKAMEVVQQKLATREQMNITIVTIELTQLVAAHRFTKNSPWIKACYGESCTWVADYEEEEEEGGDKTAWTNLRWSFDLERNEADRKDLVFTVCSKSLIVGRYVIDRTEFASIPETKSGYFEVLGDVRSSVGVSGRIRLLCLKGVAERPKGPHRDQQRHLMDTATATSSSSSVASGPTREDSAPLQRRLLIDRRSLVVKVLSVAAMDLKPVHFLESNSPFASVEVGDWVGVSEVANNAGIAARWNGLNWKFILSEEVSCEVAVHSKAIKIGRLSVSVDELLGTQPTASGTVQIIKHIVNGTQITGKVKVTMMISDVKIDSSSNKPDQQQQDDHIDDVETKVTMIDEKGAINPDHHGDLDRSDLVSSAILGEKGDLVLLKPFVKAPFVLRISEITVLDSAQASFLRRNSLSVNVVCGASGQATDEVPNCGAFAHWINLGWKINVVIGSTFRVTAWSGGTAIGAAILSVNDLLTVPTDFENHAEIFTKLLNGRKEIVGKVRLSCKYEQSIDPSSPLHAIKPGEKVADLAAGDKSSELHNNIEMDAEELSLPVSACITGISVYDMVSAHLLLKNSPQVKIAIDRKSVMTEERVGSGPMAVWTDLNWFMKIREDSYIVIALLSRGKKVGKIEVPPMELINIPVTSKGITEYKVLIKSDSQATAAKIQIRMKLSNIIIDTAPMDVAARLKEKSAIKYVSPSSRADYMRSQTLAAAASSSMRSRDGVEYGQPVYVDDDDDLNLDEGYRDPFPARSPNGYRDSYASRAASPSSYTTNEGIPSQSASTSSVVIFDTAELLAEADKQKGLDFHMNLQEIDLLALKSMHTFSSNAPTVSVACGKYIFTTKVETCMHWCFICLETYHMLLSNDTCTYI